MEFLTAYKSEVLRIASYCVLPFIAFLVSLATVYLLGRMWGVVKSVKAKNVAAFFAMLAVYAFYFLVVDTKADWVQRVWTGVIYCAITILFYVLVGFKLYDRVDAFLDKRVGKDKPVRGEK